MIQPTQGESSKGIESEPLFPTRRAFIVQFTRDDDAEAIDRYRGRVEHVLSGRSERFSTANDLIAFMRNFLEGAVEVGGNESGSMGGTENGSK